MSNISSFEELEGQTYPSFILSRGELHYLNPEYGIKEDGPFSLELPRSNIALISGDDGRGTKNNSPSYRKFIAISKIPDKRIVTAYLADTFSGPIKVETWNPELGELLKDIDMEHYDITPDRMADRLLIRHQERLKGLQELVMVGLEDVAKKTFFDMLWNVPRF